MGSKTKRAPEVQPATHAGPFKVAIMPTDDGDKILLVLRADQEDQILFWLDVMEAQDLCEALFATACSVEDQSPKEPPTKN